MQRSINERIVLVAREVDGLCQEQWLVYPNDLEDILHRHFVERWLDAPDGPGWWWMQMPEDDDPDCVSLFMIPGVGLACSHGPTANYYESAKWQRVIGPSE